MTQIFQKASKDIMINYTNVLFTLNQTTLLSVFINILIKDWDAEAYNVFYFKAFDVINLHYGIRICQKIHNRVTTTVYVKCVVRSNMHKTSCCGCMRIQIRIFKDANPIVQRSKNAWIMVMLRLVGSHWQYFILSILDL